MTNRTSAKLPAFRRLPAGVAWLAALAAMPGRAQDAPAVSVYNRSREAAEIAAAPAAASATEAAAQAERIVASAQAVLTRAETVSLKFRQKARVGDRVLVGTGRYVQSGHGEEQRFRFDSSLKCDTETFELTEVSDGLFCWTHRHHGEEPAVLQRIELRRVRERLKALNAADPNDTACYLGGMPRIVGLVRHWFRFDSATAGDLAGVPVWVVEGRVFNPYVPAIVPEMKAAAERPEGVLPKELPDGVPWGVRLMIGRTDLVLQRIEWLAIPGPRPAGDTAPEPIAVLELHDVEFDGPVDTTAFFYQPATEGLVDITDMFVNGLGLMR